MRLSKPIRARKGVDLVVLNRKRDQGYRLTMVDATNLLDVKEKTNSEKEITTEKEKKGTEFAQLIKKLGNPQRIGLGGNAKMAEWAIARSYQLPGQPEVVMEFKKKAKKFGVGIRKETSLDDQRTDIKAASSHQGGSRLISEADLASIGGSRYSEPRQPVLDSQSDRAKTYSPSSNSGGSSLAAFFGLLAMLGLFTYLASGGIHSEEAPSSTTSEYGSTGRSYGTRKETLRSGTSTLIAPEGEFQFQVTYEKAISLIPGLSEGVSRPYLFNLSVSAGCGSCTGQG